MLKHSCCFRVQHQVYLIIKIIYYFKNYLLVMLILALFVSIINIGVIYIYITQKHTKEKRQLCNTECSINFDVLHYYFIIYSKVPLLMICPKFHLFSIPINATTFQRIQMLDPILIHLIFGYLHRKLISKDLRQSIPFQENLHLGCCYLTKRTRSSVKLIKCGRHQPHMS